MQGENTISEIEEKGARYALVGDQIKAFLSGETNTYAKLANVAAILMDGFEFFWVGFYLKDNEEELVVGPYQGPLACTRIRKGKGVCGSSWELNKTIVVPDVTKYPGHIACSTTTKSEIVIPMYKNGNFIGVLDVDSDQLDHFTSTDAGGLEHICKILADSL
jgi:L-methionine (R)-S-oxide reductase